MATGSLVLFLCGVLFFSSCEGQRHLQEDEECRREHGECTEHVYENVRLAALRSSDCYDFCHCVHASTNLDGSATYMWVRQSCPPNTLFDDSLPSPVCNHAKNVQCHGDIEIDCRTEHGSCTKFIYENVRLVALKSSGCKRFCQCAHASTDEFSGVTYRWFEHTCPEGTLFDNSIRVCNYAENVQCSVNRATEAILQLASLVSETKGSVQQTEVVEHDECFEEHGTCNAYEYEHVRLVALRGSGCKNFCQCAHASTEVDGSVTYKWVKQTCPDGTLFDESLPVRVCNHEYNVQCPELEDDECFEEHGSCNAFEYDNVRVVALSGSECKDFCQCAHASTEVDGSVTYKWVKHTCKDDTLLDESLLAPVCNPEYNELCPGDIDIDCRTEHGSCTKFIYENVRLVALKSSGCKRFCQCGHASTDEFSGVTYRWFEHTCPEGTLFDNSVRVCNYAENVQCSVNRATEAILQLASLVSETKGIVQQTEVVEHDECFEEHGTCNAYEYEHVRLVALRGSGCKNFCQCVHASTEVDGSVTYKWVKQTCPDGTLFDESIPARVCNHEYNVQCPELEDDECFEEHGSCNAFEYDNVRVVAISGSECKDFCQCAHASTEVDGSATYKWVKHTCPEGTLFDESLSSPVCNHEYNVQCPVNQVETDTTSSSQTVSDTTENVPQTEEVKHDECFEEHGTCNAYEYEHVRLVALRGSGCKNFCQCAHASTEVDGSVTYKWVKQTCPEGTLFDESLPVRVCNHEYNVQCPEVEDDECFEEYGSCNAFEYDNVRVVALSGSECKNFCQCAHASTEVDGSATYKWVKHTCPEGTLFDESLSSPVCNHEYNVQCQVNQEDETTSPSKQIVPETKSNVLQRGRSLQQTVTDVTGEETDSEDTDATENTCENEHGKCTFATYITSTKNPLTSSGCQKFCQCAPWLLTLEGQLTFHWVEHTCPARTLFDDVSGVCIFADSVQC